MELTHDVGNGPFAVSAVLDALVVFAFVVWAARRRPAPARLAAGSAFALAVLAVKGMVLVKAGLEIPLGVMHVVWLDLVVVLPLAAALLGLLAWRASGRAVRALVVAGLLAAPVGAYASFVEPSRLVVEHATLALPADRVGDEPIRIALLADIQFEHVGDHERDAIARLMEQRPDLILLTGDYNQANSETLERTLPEIRRLFAELRAPAGVFAVQGDVESIGETRRIFAGTGVRTLVNEIVTTRLGDREITIGGSELHWWSARSRAFARRFERLPGDRDVRIFVAHRPDVVRHFQPRGRVDLVTAGHTHGGQLQLPLIGPLRRGASNLPRKVIAGGLHVLDGRAVYISRGVGVERGQAPRLRLGAPPEISIVELR